MTSLCIMYWWWNSGSYVRLHEGQNHFKGILNIWQWLKYVCSVHLLYLSLCGDIRDEPGWCHFISHTASALASFVSTCTMKDKCVCGYETIIHNKEEGIWFTLSSNSCHVLIPIRCLIWGHCPLWVVRQTENSEYLKCGIILNNNYFFSSQVDIITMKCMHIMPK